MEFTLEVKGLRKTYKEFGLKYFDEIAQGLCARADRREWRRKIYSD